ncbi:MAG: hypothetical protein ABGW50_01685, partial [Thermococcus sp.]
TNWWIKSQELHNAYINLRALYNDIDQIRSMIDRQISFNILLGTTFSMKLDLRPSMLPPFNFTYIWSMIKNIVEGQLMIKISFAEAFLRMHLLPKDIREFLMRLAIAEPKLADPILKLAFSTLYDIFNSKQLLELLRNIYNMLPESLRVKLDELFNFISTLAYLLGMLVTFIAYFFISLLAAPFNQTRLLKAKYDETKFNQSYYDPTVFQQILSKAWTGLMAKDFTLDLAKEWYAIFAQDANVSDTLTWDSFSRFALQSDARAGASFADYAWADVTTTGPEGREPLLGQVGVAIYGWHFLDYDARQELMQYNTEAGKEGWEILSVPGMVTFGKAVLDGHTPTDDHRPTVIVNQQLDPETTLTSVQEVGRATDPVLIGWADFTFVDLLHADTEEPGDDIFRYSPWDTPYLTEIKDTYVNLAVVNLPYAVSGLTLLEGPNSGTNEFRHTTAKDYALPYVERTELEKIAQETVSFKLPTPTPIDVHLARDALLNLFAILTSPRHWDQEALRSMRYDEMLSLWKERWKSEGVSEDVLDKMVSRAETKLKAYSRARLLQKLRSKYYRKWENK